MTSRLQRWRTSLEHCKTLVKNAHPGSLTLRHVPARLWLTNTLLINDVFVFIFKRKSGFILCNNSVDMK